MAKQGFTYILANWSGSVLYVGVTRDLVQRVWIHRQKYRESFTSRHRVNRLVYYEVFEDIGAAIKREKQLKAGPQRKKVALIERCNPEWQELLPENYKLVVIASAAKQSNIDAK